MPNLTTKKNTKAANTALKAATADGPVKNHTWSNNNAACWFTWFCLSRDVLGQTDASFAEAETVKMPALAYWNDLAPPANRLVEAQALADILTKQFTNMLGADYEEGQNYASAVLAMAAILTDRDKSITELAGVVDELHHFHQGEQP